MRQHMTASLSNKSYSTMWAWPDAGGISPQTFQVLSMVLRRPGANVLGRSGQIPEAAVGDELD